MQKIIFFRLWRSRGATNLSVTRTKTALTGLQASGRAHLGHLLGPLSECMRLNQSSDIDHMYISIADLHALTSSVNTESLITNVYNMAATLIACGIYGPKVTIFQQSKVLQHTSLAWLFMCVCPINKVQNLPQWKDKIRNLPQNESPNAGLLMYPILQAADIILYSPQIVPVGEDQIVHLELTRYLRTKLFRNISNVSELLEKYFPNPELKLCKFPKIYSLRKANKKMSKSDPDLNSKIELTDSSDTIRNKIKKALTDSENSDVTYDLERRPALANLINIYAAIKNNSINDVISEINTLTKVEFKELLSEELIKCISPIREKVHELLHDPTEINIMLTEGHERASRKAQESMDLLWQHLYDKSSTYSTVLNNKDFNSL